MTRREALLALVGGLTATVAGMPGCAGAPVLRTRRLDGRIPVPADSLLNRPPEESALVVEVEGERERFLLVKQVDGSVLALSAVCPHQACTVRPQGKFLVCPCHGSTFDLAGHVVRGPAPRDLTAYPVRRVGEAFEIQATREGEP